jgi:transcriptional regulator with XRE-family HTH domain
LPEGANTLGRLVRLHRQRQGWTLREMSRRVGIPLSTLGKVEADKLSLTYDKLQQLAAGCGLTMAQFLTQEEAIPAAAGVVTGRRSLTSHGESVRVATDNYEYLYLCAELKQKRMVPVLTRIHARSLQQFGDLLAHRGEEFIFVLEGAIEVHLQFYSPATIRAGSGVYIDSTMGHAYIAVEGESALVLAVCSSDDSDLAADLIDLAAGHAG